MTTIRKRTWNSGGATKTAWLVDYRDQEGRRRFKQFDRKKEADAWLVQTRGEVAAGTPVHDRDTITVAEAVGIWLEVCETVGRRGREPVEPHTLRAYGTHGHYIREMLGETRLNRLTGPKCVEFRDDLLKRLSRKNAAKVLTSFKSVLREMRARGLMATDPAEDVSIVVSSRHRDRLAVSEEDRVGGIPSPDQMARILAAADHRAQHKDQRIAIAWRRYRALAYVIPFTGMRMSETRGFPWPNYDPAALTMTIRQRADENGNIGVPKSAAGYRTIHVPSLLREILGEWRNHCPVGPLQLMFPNRRGKPQSNANLYNRFWRPLMKDAALLDREGRPLFDMKSLRHFYASYRIAQGANPKQIQVEMGHAHVTVTLQIYGHLFPDNEGQRPARAAAMGADLIKRRERAAGLSQSTVVTRMEHVAPNTAEILAIAAD